MSAEEQRLVDDYTEVIEKIRLYTNINLINTSGDPADEYDIEYKVRGYTIGHDGKISISRQHRLKIKLPFGYPHFPPTIKPLTSIYHPEVDDIVVPIANYWEENQSLGDLVIHIGEMLCGKIDDSGSHFNPEAAKYYKKHAANLPLDSLKLVADEKKKIEREPFQFSFLIPLIYTFSALLLLALLATGGLFFSERSRLKNAETTFEKAKVYMQEFEFSRADDTAETLLSGLDRFYLLKSSRDILKEKIDEFLDSEPLREGLKGNIKYDGKYVSITFAQKMEMLEQFLEKGIRYENQKAGQDAVVTYEKALEYAKKNSVYTEGSEIERRLTRLRYADLLRDSKTAHEGKDWGWAIEKHQELLAFIEKNERYLPNISKQKEETAQLLLLDQIAYYSRNAVAAETSNELETALENYTRLVEVIGKAKQNQTATLQDTLIDAMQKTAILTEKVKIQSKQKWLLDNYREIFPLHYPTIIVSTLKNPQVIFLKYDGENLVFDLSCLEKGTGSVVRLRVYYQYNPVTDLWSPYDKPIE